MILLRTREGRLPHWALATNQFVVVFLLIATLSNLVPTVCSRLAASLDRAACCAHSRHVQDDVAKSQKTPIPAPTRSLIAEGEECAFCHLQGGMVEALSFATPPAAPPIYFAANEAEGFRAPDSPAASAIRPRGPPVELAS